MKHTTSRTCPACQQDRLCAPWEAKRAFPNWRNWGATALLDDATVVCSWCKAVKLADGTWDRLMSVDQRAYQLSQYDNDKTKAHYHDILTAGELPGGDEGVAETGAAW